MIKIKIKNFVLLIFLIPILFVNSTGQNYSLSSEQIVSVVPIPNWEKTPSHDDIQRVMKELNTEQQNRLQKILDTNVVREMNDIIYDYYHEKTFEEPEWIRVKNFLDWMDANKDFLNRKFGAKVINLTEEHRKIYIGGFLGAHYITDKLTGKNFDLPIYWSNKGEGYMNSYGIHINADDPISAINTAIHEAVHILPFNNSLYRGDMHKERMALPESVTIFAQMKYGLPIKDHFLDVDSRLGTRTGFMIDSALGIIFAHPELVDEYADIAFSVTEYNKYSKMNNISVEWIFRPATKVTVCETIEVLLFNKVYNKFHKNKEELDYINQKLLENPVFHDTIEAIMMIFDRGLENNLTGNALKDYEIYKGKISSYGCLVKADIFFKNLRKYADKNIPPVPKGYI